MSRSRAWTLPLLLLAGSGCAVGAVEPAPSEIAVNQCKTSDDCDGNHCVANVCGSSGGKVTSLLLSITPPNSASGLTSLTYFQSYPSDSSKLSASGGNLAIDLAAPVKSSLTVSVHCAPSFTVQDVGIIPTSSAGLIPVDAIFTPSQRSLGLLATKYATQPVGNSLYEASVSVPAGTYDVYVTPRFPVYHPADEDPKHPCDVPPRLVLDQDVTGVLPYDFADPAALEVDVTWPLPDVPPGTLLEGRDANPLLGWTVELVEPTLGRSISTAVTLDSPVEGLDRKTTTYQATLVYSPVYTAVKNGKLQALSVEHDLVRLRPPPVDPFDVSDNPPPYLAPTLFAEIGGALTLPFIIQQAELAPAPVHVSLQTALEDGTPVAAGVSLTATELTGYEGISTAFSRNVQVDSHGLAEIDLLPGSYRVTAVPKTGCAPDSCLGSVQTDWLIPVSPAVQAGKTLEFTPAPVITGHASVANGQPATGATVRALPSVLIFDPNVLNSGDASSPALPRTSLGSVDTDGSFQVSADAGLFDVRVEPDPSTGFGWYIKPGLKLPEEADALADLGWPYPIVYTGDVTLTDGTPAPVPVANALIRAYAYLTPDGKLTTKQVDGGVALEVAETHADASGSYKLLIPNDIDF